MYCLGHDQEFVVIIYIEPNLRHNRGVNGLLCMADHHTACVPVAHIER